ncbi:MAG: hypothetical protein D6767_07325 [Candidatus Hydrogenedentota bacterium]|nr:MAG: hypothetical protein D6767_07325 [Candidatus Hydrogenedentota bacterium]
MQVKLSMRIIGIGLATAFLGLVILSPLFREFIRVNFLFGITFLGIFLLPALIMREWYGRHIPFMFWFVSFLTTGIYYLWFLTPNPVGLVAMLAGYPPAPMSIAREVSGYIAWLGWTIFFFAIYKKVAEKLSAESSISFSVFLIDFLAYLLYLNLAVHIFYPRFGKI